MDNEFSNQSNTSKTIWIIIILLLLFIIFVWLIWPMFKTPTNINEINYNQLYSNLKQKAMQLEQFDDNLNIQNYPFINSNTDNLIYGENEIRNDIKGAVEAVAAEEVASTIPSNYYFLDDGAEGEMSIQHNLCSKSCCSEQWPTPFKQKYDPYICANKDKFVPSKTFCNNSFQDSGCLCLTKDQAKFLYNRGGNGREWF